MTTRVYRTTGNVAVEDARRRVIAVWSPREKRFVFTADGTTAAELSRARTLVREYR